MKFFFVLQKADQNYAAYVPDLPGCVASGKTADEARAAMKAAINMHLQGLAADGLKIPQPAIGQDYLDGTDNTVKPSKSSEPTKKTDPIKKSKSSKLRELLHL
jgi:predicted RNase H-like HicB family nuclease